MAKTRFGRYSATSRTRRPSPPETIDGQFRRTNRESERSESPFRSQSVSLALRAPSVHAGAPARGDGNGIRAVAFELCPTCGKRPADTEVRIKSIRTKLCSECSKPLWHAMGLFDWLVKAIK